MESRRIPTALLVLRITVFVVMFVWTIDKFIRPAHAASVYEHFYFLRGFVPAIIYAIGIGEVLLLVGFLIGFAPRLTYGLVLLLHTVSTFSSFRQYLRPFEGSNILFLPPGRCSARVLRSIICAVLIRYGLCASVALDFGTRRRSTIDVFFEVAAASGGTAASLSIVSRISANAAGISRNAFAR
jgi:hypothetical protein